MNRGHCPRSRVSPMRADIPMLLLLALLTIIQPVLAFELLQPDCKRMLWLSGLQLDNGKGGQAQYITGSNAYMESYLVALQTAVRHAPSLLPVLAVQGSIAPEFVASIKALGGHIVQHRLTFMDTLLYHQPNVATGLLGSYLRIDVVPIVATVHAEVPGLDAVDTDYVLWTDPDVLFYSDIDSCTLPKPRYLSVGPDATPYNTDNCGVIYYNVSGFGEVHGDMVAWAAEVRKFEFFVADQDMIKGYFQRQHRSLVQHLPDTFNWKPYWGKPLVQQAIHWTKPAQISILHMHGPKLAMVQCVLDRFKQKELGQWDARWWVLEEPNAAWLNKECSCQSAVVSCTSLYALIGLAYSQDEGAFYRELADVYKAYASHGHALQHARRTAAR